tara:strand:- start:62 stop:181 length:120 start_codon:yes stop_codon:yes gene_type:complete
MNNQNKELINTLLDCYKKGSIDAKLAADTIYRIIKNETK